MRTGDRPFLRDLEHSLSRRHRSDPAPPAAAPGPALAAPGPSSPSYSGERAAMDGDSPLRGSVQLRGAGASGSPGPRGKEGPVPHHRASPAHTARTAHSIGNSMEEFVELRWAGDGEATSREESGEARGSPGPSPAADEAHSRRRPASPPPRPARATPSPARSPAIGGDLGSPPKSQSSPTMPARGARRGGGRASDRREVGAGRGGDSGGPAARGPERPAAGPAAPSSPRGVPLTEEPWWAELVSSLTEGGGVLGRDGRLREDLRAVAETFGARLDDPAGAPPPPRARGPAPDLTISQPNPFGHVLAGGGAADRARLSPQGAVQRTLQFENGGSRPSSVLKSYSGAGPRTPHSTEPKPRWTRVGKDATILPPSGEGHPGTPLSYVPSTAIKASREGSGGGAAGAGPAGEAAGDLRARIEHMRRLHRRVQHLGAGLADVVGKVAEMGPTVTMMLTMTCCERHRPRPREEEEQSVASCHVPPEGEHGWSSPTHNPHVSLEQRTAPMDSIEIRASPRQPESPHRSASPRKSLAKMISPPF